MKTEQISGVQRAKDVYCQECETISVGVDGADCPTCGEELSTTISEECYYCSDSIEVTVEDFLNGEGIEHLPFCSAKCRREDREMGKFYEKRGGLRR